MKNLILALVISLSIPVFTGCASALRSASAALPVFAGLLAEAEQTLEYIDAGVSEWKRLTDPPSNQIARYEAAKKNCYRGLMVATRALQGAEKVEQQQFDAAFLEFRKAYEEMQTFLAETGAVQGGALKAGQTPDPIPVPMALSHKVEG